MAGQLATEEKDEAKEKSAEKDGGDEEAAKADASKEEGEKAADEVQDEGGTHPLDGMAGVLAE